jgi:DNA-directed RNA polymerase specialized sigma24 family protein
VSAVESIASLVEDARSGDLAAFARLIRRFQAMAYGYAYSSLGDFSLAEDAAQGAFVEAYRKLDDLREPAAFPGWFRRIVFKYCDRTSGY